MAEDKHAVGRVTVIGDGQMGLVMADALHASGRAVRLWGPFEETVQALARTRTSDRLPGFELDPGIQVETDATVALEGADMVL